MPLRASLIAALTVLAAGCGSSIDRDAVTPVADSAVHDAIAEEPGSTAPAGVRRLAVGPVTGLGDSFQTAAAGPVAVDLGSPQPEPPLRQPPAAVGPIDRPIPEEEVARLRRQALLAPPAAGVRRLLSVTPGAAAPGSSAPIPGISFEGPAFPDTAGFVPPDPELAAGPAHLVAVVNSTLVVYDKLGAVETGPTSLATLFSGTPDCVGTKFDPNVLYDEEADRFFIGADGGGSSYCMAVTASSDPTGIWLTYGLITEPLGAFFDYPHAGVGSDAIYMGANIFSGGFLEARVWAIDKWAMYAGATSPMVVNHSTGSNSTPQPANLHGFAQGTWPPSGPHYLLTDDELFSGSRLGVWSWEDPFGIDRLERLGEVDLDTPSAVPAAFPILVPQNGPGLLESNDWRVLDAEFRNGRLWATQTIACNPGPGAAVVNCIRWAEIDPSVPVVVDAGVFGSEGQHRFFPDGAANHCGDLALGYTRSSSISFPSIWFTGRRSDAVPQTIEAEAELRNGDLAYSAFDGSPYRWGDYTGMTPDPDGLGFWYLGEYSKDLGAGFAGWGTYVGAFAYPGCPILAPAPLTVDLGAVEVGLSAGPQEIVLSNPGNDLLSLTGMAVSDPVRFSLDVSGGTAPCHSTQPALAAGQSCTVAVGFDPDSQAAFAAFLTVDAAEPSNRRDLPLAGVGFHPCPHPAEQWLTSAVEENGQIVIEACQRVIVGPYRLGSAGELRLIAGDRVELAEGTVISGDLAATIDPFLALP